MRGNQCKILYSHWLRLHLALFYHSKVKFTIVTSICSVTDDFRFTIVNVIGVCRDSNRGRMKEKLTMVKRPEKAWFITRLSKLCLFKWQLVYSLGMEGLKAPEAWSSCTISIHALFSCLRIKTINAEATLDLVVKLIQHKSLKYVSQLQFKVS